MFDKKKLNPGSIWIVRETGEVGRYEGDSCERDKLGLRQHFCITLVMPSGQKREFIQRTTLLGFPWRIRGEARLARNQHRAGTRYQYERSSYPGCRPV